MHPELFKIGNITIYSYGVMLAIGFLMATFLTAEEAKRRSLNKDLIIDFAFVLIISGLIGARILYVFLNWRYFLQNPLEIIMLNQGGLVWYGGLIAAVASLIVFSKIKNQDFLIILDLFAPYAALGQSLGRIGCFLRGCCFGKPTDSILGVYFPVHEATLYPTQLISSFALLAIFISLRCFSSRLQFKGGLFFTYLMLYSLVRFFIEFLRGDSLPVIFGLSAFQLMSIPVFIISLFLFFKCKNKN